MNLYDQLGLDKGCTAGDVKRAYRAKAKRHHPDMGGAPEVFNRISIAYRTLKDNESRARYDYDGTIATPAEEQNKAVALAGEILVNSFRAAVSKLSPERMKTKNVMAFVRSEISTGRDKASESILTLQARVEQFEDMIARVKKKGQGPDYIKAALTNELFQTRLQLKSALTLRESWVLALDLLVDYSWKVDPLQDKEWIGLTGDFG